MYNPIYRMYNPSGYVKIVTENGPVEIVNFPINSMVNLSIVFCTFTRCLMVIYSEFSH